MTQSHAMIPSLLIVMLFHPLLFTPARVTTVKRYARHYAVNHSTPVTCAHANKSRDAAFVFLVGVGERLISAPHNSEHLDAYSRCSSRRMNCQIAPRGYRSDTTSTSKNRVHSHKWLRTLA